MICPREQIAGSVLMIINIPDYKNAVEHHLQNHVAQQDDYILNRRWKSEKDLFLAHGKREAFNLAIQVLKDTLETPDKLKTERPNE